MKKSVIIAIIAVVILVVIGGVIFVNLNKEKASITASSFYTTMSQKGYSVQDSTSQYSEYDYVKQVYIAVSKDYSYQIEFYELLDASAETSVGLKNYSKYTLSSNGQYMVVSKINNTVIYVKVDDDYKNTVKDILEELGY